MRKNSGTRRRRRRCVCLLANPLPRQLLYPMHVLPDVLHGQGSRPGAVDSHHHLDEKAKVKVKAKTKTNCRTNTTHDHPLKPQYPVVPPAALISEYIRDNDIKAVTYTTVYLPVSRSRL
ncbi:unnamed protein product [Soboliphyme baturini]|uniref:Uncharacterized protein n=1 Tax=Soboliphyme baturini TaxID=241478 RepID=A0A183IH82_9BILA|nr:unnamed protein product [Soboliphyme baturini]